MAIEKGASGGGGLVAVALLALLPGCPVEDNPAPASVQIAPAEGLAGTTFPVTVRGTNTHFSSRGFAAHFEGRGVRISGTRVSGETAARLEVAVDADATAGPRNLRIDAAPDSFLTTLEVRVPGVQPSIEMIRPRFGGPGAELELTIEGAATHFEPDVTTVQFPEGAGVTVLSVNVASPTLAFASIRISADAPGGRAGVAVITRDELVVGEFEVVTTARAAVSAEPPEGYSGRDVEVVVSGSRADFGVPGDAVTLSFDAGAGVAVSGLQVLSPTRLSARFSIAARASAGFRRFTVRVVPAEVGAEAREFAGTFSVRAPGNPSVRLLPPAVHRGQTALLWLEGRGTAFRDGLSVRPDAGSGLELTGVWVLGPAGAALRVRADDDAAVGTTTFTIDDGAHDDLAAAVEVLEDAETALEASPALLEAGSTGVEVTLTSPAADLDAALTRADAAPGSGIAIRSLEVASPSRATVTVDVSETAPTGPTSLGLSTGTGSSSRAVVTVAPPGGQGSITVEPPVVRAGIGPVDLVLTAHGADLGPGTLVELSDPSLGVSDVVVDEEAEIVRLTVDVSRAAAPGAPVVTLADGPDRWATTLQVLDDAPPRVVAAPSSLSAGRAGQVVVLFGEATSWLADVTAAAAPAGRGLSVDGLTVLDASTAVLEVTVSTEAPAGPTGIILATHGELAVAPFEVDPPAAPPSITLEPPAVEPGTITTISIRAQDFVVPVAPVRVDFPGSPEVRVLATRVIDDSTLEADVAVDPGAVPGTRPCEVEAPGLAVRAGLAVRTVGGPAAWIDPSRVRRGRTTRLDVRVDGMDLSGGPVTAVADAPEVVVGEVLVGESADRASVDVTVDSDAAVEAFWLTLSTADAEVRHLLLMGPVLPTASVGASSVEAGTRGTELVIAGEQTTFAPEETLVLPGASSDALRFGAPVVASPGQLRLEVDVSAAAEVEVGQAVLVTGSELVPVSIPIVGATRVVFDAPGSVQGSVLPDRGALLAYAGEGGTLQWLRVEPDAPDPPLVLELLAPDGFGPLAPAVTSPTSLVVALPAGALARVHVASGEGPGEDALPFSFHAEPLVPDAARELEPNDDGPQAELFPDPVTAPTVMQCAIGPTGDRDSFVVSLSTPVAVEVFSRRLAPGVGAPDLGMRAPPEGTLFAPALGADLVAVLDPAGPGDDASLAIEGLTGAVGFYLVVARSAVVVNELGWNEDGGYIELRGTPAMPLDGYSFEVDDAGQGVLLPEVDLEGVSADDTGLLLLDPATVPGLDLPEDGAVVVRWHGQPVDEVAFGAAIGGEGDPIDLAGAVAVARRLGIDRNDNAKDFTPTTASPGAD